MYTLVVQNDGTILKVTIKYIDLKPIDFVNLFLDTNEWQIFKCKENKTAKRRGKVQL